VAREFGAKRFRCTTLLKPQEYNILLVEAPAVKPEELKSAVRWRIKDMLDYHVDDATIDVLDVPVPAGAAQRTHYMYTVAARNETIRATLDRFNAGGMPLTVIDIPDTAQRNVAVRLEAEQRGVGGAHLRLRRAADDGQLQRRALPFAAAGRHRAGLADAQARSAPPVDRVLMETQRSLDYCERSYPFFSLGRMIVGPFAGRRRAARAPRGQSLPAGGRLELGQVVACRPRRAAGAPSSRPLAEADRRRLARGEEGAMSQQINLYSPIFRKQTKIFSRATMVQGLGLIVLVIAVFYYYVAAQARCSSCAWRIGPASEGRARARQAVRRARVARRAA
jgi:hypothetical protein